MEYFPHLKGIDTPTSSPLLEICTLSFLSIFQLFDFHIFPTPNLNSETLLFSFSLTSAFFSFLMNSCFFLNIIYFKTRHFNWVHWEVYWVYFSLFFIFFLYKKNHLQILALKSEKFRLG